MENHKLIPIGHVGVDSGRLLIVDPAHLSGDELQTLLQQLDIEQHPPSNVSAQQLNYSRGHAGLGVVLVAGWGDGSYTVEADTFVDESGFTINHS